MLNLNRVVYNNRNASSDGLSATQHAQESTSLSRMRSYGTWIQHPILLLSLLSFTFFICWNLFVTIQPWFFLQIPGYPIQQKQEAYILLVMPGCSCDQSAEDWLKTQASTGKNIVVISQSQSSWLQSLQSKYQGDSVRFIYSADKNLIYRLSPKGTTTLSYVRRGNIVSQQRVKD